MRTQTEYIRNEGHLKARLIELSKTEGGAWAYSVTPFTHETTFYQAASPSKLPDWLMDLSRKTVAYKGKLRRFSPAAMLREQNRGITCQ